MKKFGDGVMDAAKDEFNREAGQCARELVRKAFAYIREKAEDLPATLESLLSDKKVEDDVISLWANQLYTEGIVPKGYVGLQDEDLVHNLQQEGYIDGMYVGYIQALVAMIDNGVEKEKILAVRDALRANLWGHRYEDSAEFTNLLKDEKYEWIKTEN